MTLGGARLVRDLAEQVFCAVGVGGECPSDLHDELVQLVVLQPEVGMNRPHPMRRRTVLLLAPVFMLAACARPVLYYPTPESAGAASTSAVVATVRDSTPALSSEVAAMSDDEYLHYRHIIVPVAGADMSRVDDSFTEPRDGGERVHRAIDILAPRGTPILSADDGRILRMSTNALGGISMYTVDTNARLVYYYAHMDHYNDAMLPGRTIVRGDTLGFVGTTGNAPKDTPHLHFQVMRWPLDGKYWNGEPINPFDALGGVHRSREKAPEQ